MGKRDDDDTNQSEDVLARLTTALEALAAKQTSSPSDQSAELMIKLTDALTMLAAANAAGSKMIADETRRAHRPSNEVVPMRSVFNRRGQTLDSYKKPLLRCPTFMPWQLDDDSLTREEVELANLLEQGEFIVRRNDGTEVLLIVQILMNLDKVTPSRVLVNHTTAFKNDSHNQMPSLVSILRQILRKSSVETRAKSALVLSDDDEEMMIAAGELTVSV